MTVTHESAASGSNSDTEFRYVVAPLTHIDVRDPSNNPDNTWTMSGYAAVFNQATTFYDGKFVRMTESIAPTFFDRILRDQQLSQPEGVVHFNFGHDMNRAVAATDVPAGQPGSLQLKADAHGLHYFAKVPRDDPDGVAMAAKMRSGVLKQASFAFTVSQADIVYTENEDGPDQEHRTLVEGKHLYDVCACSQGAYHQTISSLRSYAAALGQPNGGQPNQATQAGLSVVTHSGGDADIVNTPEHQAAIQAADEALTRAREAMATRLKPRKAYRK